LQREKPLKKALICGISASLFFAFTFILNRSMNLSGGYWLWISPLRYLITFAILALVLALRPKKGMARALSAVKAQPGPWLLWSTVGFGLFYLPLTLGSVFGESWMTASTWQLTIVAGVMLTPLFGKKIPVKNLLLSTLIVIGVFIMQVPHLHSNHLTGNLMALVPILIAAFMYPLGNRKIMTICPPELDTMERIFNMVFCSLPFWIVTALAAFLTGGAPSSGQLLQSLGVALFSGVIATSLFFHATDLVKDNPRHLAVIEATQCGEVIFTLLGGVLILHAAAPSIWGCIGIILIVAGMVANRLNSN
jgi:drug/metabolite transporter (DMT)-like permease